MTKGAELTKRCSDCGAVLPVSQFNRNGARGDGYQHICRACTKVRQDARPKRSWTNAAQAEAKARAEARRAVPKLTSAEKQRAWRENSPEKHAALRKKHYCAKYGLTPERYDEMRVEQKDQCAICLVDLPEKPHIDHDHYNGQTRALLCATCNIGLGMMQDSPDVLRRAATYIEFWNVVHESADAEMT